MLLVDSLTEKRHRCSESKRAPSLWFGRSSLPSDNWKYLSASVTRMYFWPDLVILLVPKISMLHHHSSVGRNLLRISGSTDKPCPKWAATNWAISAIFKDIRVHPRPIVALFQAKQHFVKSEVTSHFPSMVEVQNFFAYAFWNVNSKEFFVQFSVVENAVKFFNIDQHRLTNIFQFGNEFDHWVRWSFASKRRQDSHMTAHFECLTALPDRHLGY